MASPDGADGSVTIHQDARLYATVLTGGGAVTHTLAPGRHAWLHVARGAAQVGDLALGAGDAISTSDPGALTIAGDAEVLLFDLA